MQNGPLRARGDQRLSDRAAPSRAIRTFGQRDFPKSPKPRAFPNKSGQNSRHPEGKRNSDICVERRSAGRGAHFTPTPFAWPRDHPRRSRLKSRVHLIRGHAGAGVVTQPWQPMCWRIEPLWNHCITHERSQRASVSQRETACKQPHVWCHSIAGRTRESEQNGSLRSATSI